jgi:three-Cys-motif partner protein
MAVENHAQESLFEVAGDEPQGLLDGSAKLALRTEPPFDRYVFIERRADRCKELEVLSSEFPARQPQVEILHREASAAIQKLARGDWRSDRAVLFLDPYGMQVEWETIVAIAETKAIDLWVLFPLGIGVNRLLTKSGDIPTPWRHRLDLLLGSTDWYDEFYRVERTLTMFGDAQDHVVKASMETIGRYFIERLRSVFAAVADTPMVLRNSANCPLYLLCFAVGNERGAPVALRIANHLLTHGAG